jgi:phosphoglycolate phosphatase
MHVMEHIPCDVTAVLFHLHRALKNDGYHIFCIPVITGTYASDFGELSREQAQRKFGHHDHVRRFGADDLEMTLGMVFRLPPEYDLTAEYDSSLLDSFNIPPYARTGWSPHNVLVKRKGDIKLASARPAPR